MKTYVANAMEVHVQQIQLQKGRNSSLVKNTLTTVVSLTIYKNEAFSYLV